jgi:hypothetical protein
MTSGRPARKGNAEAWKRVLANPTEPKGKAREFGPQQTAAEALAFEMPKDPFAQLRPPPEDEEPETEE